jgi:ATP-dependent RNA helicase DeaD
MDVSDATPPATPPVTFDALPLTAEVRRAIDELGYVHPTPVQKAVFESAVRGKDLVVQARTGTGKTAAFGLPLIDSIVRRNQQVVQALVLCPTRELALQVTRELDAIAKHRGTKVVAIYGGAPMPRQIEQIQNGAQILVGTPGRVLDHLSRGTLDGRAIRTFVLDESDEMLSMGFLPQINEILSHLPDSRQTLLFSATLPPDIRRIAETRLREPEFITLSGDHIGALEINHFVYLSRGDKLSELLQVLSAENPESAVIFSNTRDDTKRVAAALQQEGFAADWLNADLAQNDREKVMAATREGRLRFLVATDVASRGIDISHLTHVINFDFPESAEAYVHRTGRTGRAGRTGTAISLIEPSDIGNLYLLRLTYKLKPIERSLPTQSELKTRAESDLVRWFVDGLATRSVHPEDLALARRLLSHERAEVVVAALLRDHLGARPDAQDEATAARRARPPRAAESAAASSSPALERTTEGRSGRRPPLIPGRRAETTSEGRDEPAARQVRPERSPPMRRVERAERTPLERTPPQRTEREPAAERDPVVERAPEAVERAERSERDPAEGRPPRPPRVRPEPTPAVDRATPPVPEHSPGGEDVVELYASVGRRQGAKPSDYERQLLEAGVPAESVAYVRVRHRNAFVGIDKNELERALSALDGADIGGARVKAELSRGRSALVENDAPEPLAED